jgi:putative aminopeptidase FrvX
VKALIKKLAEAWGPPGYEHRVRDLIRAEIEPLADDVWTDPLGNLICQMGQGECDVMLAAHMDEIGLIVGHLDRQGYARFASLGTLFPAALLGARVRFENGVIGTVGVEHQFTKRRELPALSGFYIDISQDANGSALVNVGDPAAFAGDVIWRGKRVIGKSLDDRLGCAIQIEVMRRLKETGTPNTIYCVFTVQEEVGSRGAGPAAFGLEPDLALVLDVASAGDMPHGRKNALTLGGGVAILARDAGLIVPAPVKELLIRRADEGSIPYQINVAEGSATDGRAIQVARSGVLTGGLSVPVRYVHTTSETADQGDIQAAVDLLVAVVGQSIPL